MTNELSKEARADAITSIQQYFHENMPEPIGNPNERDESVKGKTWFIVSLLKKRGVSREDSDSIGFSNY